MKQVRQIIPANGWQAIYEQEDGGLYAAPLCCWAVVEDEDGDSFVVGMDADSAVGACEEVSNFVGFIGPGEDLYKYVEADK